MQPTDYSPWPYPSCMLRRVFAAAAAIALADAREWEWAIRRILPSPPSLPPFLPPSGGSSGGGDDGDDDDDDDGDGDGDGGGGCGGGSDNGRGNGVRRRRQRRLRRRRRRQPPSRSSVWAPQRPQPTASPATERPTSIIAKREKSALPSRRAKRRSALAPPSLVSRLSTLASRRSPLVLVLVLGGTGAFFLSRSLSVLCFRNQGWSESRDQNEESFGEPPFR